MNTAQRSEYSCVSSSSSELSVEEVRDPFLVSMHIIANPGKSRVLQEAINNLLVWLHPDLKLFQVSERRVAKKPDKAIPSQPALAVILFLKEEHDEEPILQLYKSFQKPPWYYHHTERVHGKFLPYMPGSQDFFTLAQGTPLWAIRPVHYGKEIIRFTIYCRNENFANIMKLYELILKRPVNQKKADFCVFPIYSNVDLDIQFSLKRLPRGQEPNPTESAVLEFRVKSIEQLAPLLPNLCSQISEDRWQTEDLDGNKILLQQAKYKKCVKELCCSSPSRSSPVTPLLRFVPHSNRWALNRWGPSKPLDSIAFHNTNQCLGVSQQDLRNYYQEGCLRRPRTAPTSLGSFQRSRSLVCLPTTGSSLATEVFHSSEPNSLSTFSSASRTLTRVNLDDLEGVQETDVDTGLNLTFSDLSVVSAYSVPDDFSNNTKARTKQGPSQQQLVNRFKQIVSVDRSPPARSNSFKLFSRSLPFGCSSSSSASPSGPPSAASLESKCLPRRAMFSFDDDRTTGGGKNNEEEEFYI
uniref:Family with sequence similarity 124 member A n=1 Tax=Salvator merianae TaxID=96440 RepID=A0A8D0BE59_SALMN